MPSGSFEQLQNGRDGAHPVQVVALRIVDVGLFLGDQQDALVGLHGQIQRHDGLFPADEQRDHHVRIDDHVTQRQHGHAGVGWDWCRGIDCGFVAHGASLVVVARTDTVEGTCGRRIVSFKQSAGA